MPSGKSNASQSWEDHWPPLLRRCRELGITPHKLGIQRDSIEDELQAIATSNKKAGEKNALRKKLKKRVQRAIDDAEASAAAASTDATHPDTGAAVVQLPFSRLQPCKRPRAGAGDAAGPPARRPSWVAATVLFVPFDGMLDGCHKRDAFDGRLDESEWDANEFDGELRECAYSLYELSSV